MKLTDTLKKQSRKLVAASMLTVLVAGFAAFSSATALTVSTSKDCDTNAVMYCGATSTSSVISKYTNGDTKNSAASIHNIYSYFGISSSEISSLNSTAVAGSVTKSGNVYVGSQLVATNALTTGRANMSGSTHVSSGGTSFYTRTPSVSFRSNSLAAFVVMQNGKFSYAILASCGNPVKATPKTPDYSVVKEVRAKGESTYHKAVTVPSGAHVQYRVTVKSTGAVAAVNVLVHDTLPSHVSYVPGTLTRDGSAVSNASAFFSSTGNTITSLVPGKSVVYTFEGVAGTTSETSTSCKPENTMRNTASISSPGLPGKSSSADVSTTCKPPKPSTPVYSCNLLSVDKEDSTRTVTITDFQTSQQNGATYSSVTIDWGDNTDNFSGDNPKGATHTYKADGSYTITATAHFTVNDKSVSATSEGCKAVVSFNAPPVTPPSELPDTGAGSLIGLATGAVIAGVAVHRFYLIRRLGR